MERICYRCAHGEVIPLYGVACNEYRATIDIPCKVAIIDNKVRRFPQMKYFYKCKYLSLKNLSFKNLKHNTISKDELNKVFE